MIETLSFNLNTIFYPSSAIKARLNRKGHLRETIFLLWPILLFNIFFEIYALSVTTPNISIVGWGILLFLFKGLIFPFVKWCEVYFNYFFLRLILPSETTDKTIDCVIANSIAAGVFLVIPLVGDIFSYIINKVLLFHGVMIISNKTNAALALVLPLVLSITFLVFLGLCLALISLSLMTFF